MNRIGGTPIREVISALVVMNDPISLSSLELGSVLDLNKNNYCIKFKVSVFFVFHYAKSIIQTVTSVQKSNVTVTVTQNVRTKSDSVLAMIFVFAITKNS